MTEKQIQEERVKYGVTSVLYHPKCHRDAGFEIFRDLKTGRIIIACAKCETPIVEVEKWKSLR